MVLKQDAKDESWTPVCMLSHFSCVWLFTTLWTVARQAPLSMGFSRQEYWSGLPCPFSENLPNPGIEPASFMSPALTGRFFNTTATWGAHWTPLYLIPHTTRIKDIYMILYITMNSWKWHQKHKQQKEKNKLDFIKVKNVGTTKDIIKKEKTIYRMGENIYKSQIWWKSSIQNMLKNICNSVTQRQLDLKMAKGLEKNFLQRRYTNGW